MLALLLFVVLALVAGLAFVSGQLIVGVIAGALCFVVVLGQFGFLDSILRS